MEVLGIDVGGTGIKVNIVNIETGQALGEKLKIKTPIPAEPEAIIECLKMAVDNFSWLGKNRHWISCRYKNGISLTASNIDPKFINYNIDHEFSIALASDVKVVNDADAAGLAEMTYGKGKGVNGLVLFLTLGTGIGSALFFNGQLLPNTELGHLKYKNLFLKNMRQTVHVSSTI